MDSDAEIATTDLGGEIALPEKLDTAAAKMLHAALWERAEQDVVLDGASVTMLGGRCLDLLLSAKHHWQASGRSVTLKNASDALIRDLQTFGQSAAVFAEGEAA